jgi:transcriptional regulator with XRE-family HTH domain
MKRGKKVSTGAALKEVMGREGISAYRVSKETGIEHSYISKILHDKIDPGTKTLKRILDVLGYEVRFVKPKKEQ